MYKFNEEDNQRKTSFTNKNQHAASFINKINTQQVPRTKSVSR